MKRYILILLILGSTIQLCTGQRKSEQDERLNSNCLETIERRINRYADSLNFWIAGTRLPQFLFEPKFDQNHFFGNDCIRDRNTFSHRKAIIDRVSNTQVLNEIVRYKSALLDSLYILSPEEAARDKTYFENFSYATYSMRYLAERRLERIAEIKKGIIK